LKLLKLQIENFRNHRALELDFTQADSHIFVGKNGLGKTNVIEAIHIASLARSFRTANFEELIQWDQDYFRTSVLIEKNHEELPLEVFYSHRPARKKNYRLAGVSVSASNYIGHFPTVLFQPEDLNLISLSPQVRRHYLDMLLCQTDRDYIVALANYKKILKQRNALLKNLKARLADGGDITAISPELAVWDRQIAESGQIIIEKRLRFIEFLNQILTELYRELSADHEQLKASYHSSIQSQYLASLSERHHVDILQGATTRGPHRDDLHFFLNDRPMTATASRGEFRTLLLALKLAEIEYIKSSTGQTPVLLLDDVFSELDPERRQKLLTKIQNCQSIITTTDLNDTESGFRNNVKICYNISS